MFREMRLKADNQIPEAQAKEIMANAVYGVLAVDGDDDYPYAVPVNYAYDGDKIYFHGALEGHKVDAVKRNEKVSICVVSKSDIVPDAFNCLFESAIAFGRVKIVDDDATKQKALELVIAKYSKGFEEAGAKYIETSWDAVQTYVMDVEHITGKKGI